MANDNNNETEARTDALLGDDAQMLTVVRGQLNKARRDKVQAELKKLVEQEIQHETALQQTRIAQQKLLSDYRAGILPA